MNLTLRMCCVVGLASLGWCRAEGRALHAQEPATQTSDLNFADLPAMTPTAFGDEAEIRVPLPATIDDLCVGGGGRFVLLYFKALSQIGVFDVSEGKIAGYIAAPGSQLKFAAGANRLVTVASDLGVVSRWNLLTRQRELTKPITAKSPVSHVLLGCASAGPAVVGFGSDRIASETVSIDLRQLESRPMKFGQNASRGLTDRAKAKISANGETICVWELGVSPSGLQTYVRQGDSFQGFYEHDTVGAIVPSADGRVIFTFAGIFTSQLVRTIEARGFLYSPATHGDFYLRVPVPGMTGINRSSDKNVSVTLHKLGDDRPIVTLPIKPAFDEQDNWGRAMLTLEQRMIFVPKAGSIVLVPASRDHLLVQRFDLQSALDNAGIDYLFVASEPKRSVELGGTYAYDIEVKSKRGDVEFELASGPQGMQIDEAGKVSWKVPDDFNQAEATIIVGMRDGSGQELLHTFAISIAGVAERLRVQQEEELRRREQAMREAQIAETKRLDVERAMQAKLAEETQQRRVKWLAEYPDAVARDDAAKPLIAAPVEYPIRKWTDAVGESLQARYVTVFAGSILLQLPDGARLGVPGVQLSAEDRAYATKLFRQALERRGNADRWKAACVARQGDPERRAALKQASVEKLTRIQQALEAYTQERKSLPPVGNFDAQTRYPLLSWRVHLLPYLGEQELFAEFRMDEPWCSQRNLALLSRMPDVFNTPGGLEGHERTHYVRVGAAAPGNGGGLADRLFQTRLQRPDLGAGVAELPVLLEVGDPLAATWTRPDEFDSVASTVEAQAPHLFGLRDGGCLVVTANGSVKRIDESVAITQLVAWLQGQADAGVALLEP